MAWQVYDTFEGSWSRTSTIYGPLPCKRWVPDGKPYRLKHKITPAYRDMRDAEQKRATDERRAIQYARWLAARDGKAIPALPVCRVQWDGIYSATETRTIVSGYPKRPQAIAAYLKRIRAVEWGWDEKVYNTRKDGTRGAYLCTEFRAEFTIEIPHWDWEPAAPIEETELEFRLAAY